MTSSELLRSSPRRGVDDRLYLDAVDGGHDVAGPTEWALCRALLGLRWAGLVLATVVVVYDRHQMQRPATAWWALAAMAALTAGATLLWRWRPGLLLHPTLVVLEGLAAIGIQAADGWVFGPVHAFDAKALGTIWVLAPVMTAGITWGPFGGGGVGLAVGAARLLGALAPDLAPLLQRGFGDDGQPRFLAAATTITLCTIAGAGAGYITVLLRRAGDEIADLRARQRVAATLHDGALQALAYIARRAADPDIARVARDADIELRGFLTASLTPDTGELHAALTTAMRRTEHHLDGHLHLAIDDELPDRPPHVVAAVVGAVTEAVTNAAKHAGARHVTVYAAPEQGGVRITINDDGVGFDPDAVPAGGGLDQSLRARIRHVGGAVTIRSRLGDGTEVELWIP